MNAFENLVANLLEREGLWVRNSVKVNLTKDDKKRIGRPSSPRWELDLVAYRPGANEVRIIECKSYLDSHGVADADFDPDGKYASRYKLFTDSVLRAVVTERLSKELVAAGFCKPNPTIKLGLAVGRIKSDRDRQHLAARFEREQWILLDRDWMLKGIQRMAEDGYENSVASMVAKLLWQSDSVMKTGSA